MKNMTKSMIAFLLSFVFIISSFLPITAVESKATAIQPTQYSSQSNSGQRDVVCTTLDGTSADNYYTGSYDIDNLVDLSGDTLFDSLQNLMRTTHSYTTSYNYCRDNVWKVDCENNDTSKATTLYSNYHMTSSDWTPTWSCNREHVWPQSLGGGNTSGGGADLHHIRPEKAGVNSSRGNKMFGYASGQYVPADNAKGDVARIILYVWVRWENDWGAGSVTEVFQSVDVLLEWCALDPVDTWEMGRNEVVQGIQGNRNVFIDYPELAWLIFDREIPDDMVTPSGIAANGSQGGNGGSGDSGNTGGDTTCAHTNTELRGAAAATCTKAGHTGDTYCTDCGEKIESGSVIPATNHKNTEVRGAYSETCAKDGYTGDTHCLDCGQQIADGQVIPAHGNHSFGEWTSPGENQSHERVCSTCGNKETIDLNGLLSHANSDAERILILLMLGISDSLVLEGISE